MNFYLLVLKENRYSFSPIISIADYFSFKLKIIYLKDFIPSKNENYSDEIVYKYIENQFIGIKITNDFNIFFFSLHSWYRKFFMLVLKLLKENFPESLFVSGGPDVIANPYLYVNYFDLICNSEGEGFLIDFFNIINQLKEKNEIDINPQEIHNCISSKYNIRISKRNTGYEIKKYHSTSFVVSNKNDINVFKNFLQKFYIKFSEKLFPSEKSKLFGYNTENNDLNQILNKILIKINQISNYKELFKFFPSFPVISSFYHPVEIVRGCPQGCHYCQVSNIFGKNFRKKDIDIVKVFLSYQIRNGKNHIRFISPDFTLFFHGKKIEDDIQNWESLISFIKYESEKINSPFYIYLGSFPSELSLRSLKTNYLELISKYSSTKKITIGIQTASKRLQKIINRSDPLDNIEGILKDCIKYNLEPIIDIIFGLPYENINDRDITLSFLEKNLNNKISANIHYFLPIPGTNFQNEVPVKLANEEIKRINRLMSKGLVSGNFFRQMAEFENRLQMPITYLQNL